MNDVVLKLKGITKTYHQGDKKLEILKGIDFELKRGEVVSLVGASGTGKSTLLQIAGLLDHPTKGEIWIGDCEVQSASDDKRTALRLGELGFVYQFHHLLPDFTALENVSMPMIIAGVPKAMVKKLATERLAALGLEDRKEHYPSQLSGGEQQRVAIARAIANQPTILFADEPTGNLDEETSARVMANLIDTVRNTGLAAIIATHDRSIAEKMDRMLTLREGKLIESKRD
jgi:lipoprotein-releasing system ATP-binding protein